MKYETPLTMRNIKTILFALFLFPILALGQVITPVDLDPPSDTPREGFQKLNTNDANIKARLDSIANAIDTLVSIAQIDAMLDTLGGGGGSGTVESVAMTVPTGLTVSGSPITTTGTFAIGHDTGYGPYSDSEASKLSGIEVGADVTDSTNVAAAGAVMNGVFTWYLQNITAYLGSSGTASTMMDATAVDRIPTTALSTGTRITAVVTISGTERRLYNAELITPSNSTAGVEISPSVIRPNDFNASTNNKVWREIKNSGIIDVSHYGVVPGAAYVSDQINAIISAASAGSTLVFPPGEYNIFAITANKALNFVGFGATFIFSTVNVPHFVITADLVTVRGFKFVGRGRAHASYPAQGAIRITTCSNVVISDCIFDQMPFYGIQTGATHISDLSADFGGISVSNCLFTRSKFGIHSTTRGEYVNYSNCTITDCDTGALIAAGNINITGGQITDCSVGIELASGVNDSHGIVSGVQINHNITAIISNGIENGHFFRGCNIYFGDMEITDSDAITFDACTIGGVESFWDNSSGVFQNCIVDSRASSTVITTDWNGNASEVFTFNNKAIDGTFPSGWNKSEITIDSINISSAATLPAATTIGDVSATEIGYVDGVTSAIQTQLNSKTTTALTASTGTAIAFDIPRRYGTHASPVTGNITYNGTGAIVGQVQTMIHNDSSEPTWGSEFDIISGTYTTSTNNKIMLFLVESGVVWVTISQ